MASSQNTELDKKLKRFIYETAAMKGRRLERAVMAQFRVTAPEDPIGPGVDMHHYKLPEPRDRMTDAADISGVEKSSNSFSNKRVSPQDTGNFISSIHAEDNIDQCVQTLSGVVEVNVGTDMEGYILKPKGTSWGRRSGTNVKVPWSRTKKYRRNLEQYNNDDIPDDWLANWDKIVRSNMKRII